MKTNIDYEKMARRYGKRKIFSESKEASCVNYPQEDIKKIIKHRPPFLFIDYINEVNLENKTIRGSFLINKEEPAFKGHFPDYPIFPGVLHLEMIGQLGLCLHQLQLNKELETNIPEDIRLTKICHAIFQKELLPNDNVEILYHEFESDDFTTKGIGQILKQGKICTVAIAEFYKINN